MTALLDRCIFLATSSGTGDFVVSSAVGGYQTPAAAGAINGATYHYAAQSNDLSQWEVGTGTYTVSSTTLSRTTVLFNSSGTTAKISFTVVPRVMITALAEDFIQTTYSNLTFYVATTGSDSNPGTSGSPFATIQHAVNVAAQYNYQNLYAPTINLATGTYNEQVILPALTNCPAGGIVVGNTGTPSNVKVADLGTAYAFTWAPFSIWTVEGIQLTGTYGGFSGDDSVAVGFTIGWIDFAGAIVNAGINLPAGYTEAFCSGPLTTSASSMGWLIFARGPMIFDTMSITFTNAITFSHSLISADSISAFLGFYNSTFTNGSNVTCSSACLVLANGAFFETGPTTNVDGTALTRANFPGHASGFSIDQWSTFQPDGFTSRNAVLGGYSPATTDANFIFLSDGAGNVRADYGKTNASSWTLETDQLALTSNNTNSTAFQFNNTSTGGHDFSISSTGSANAGGVGNLVLFDATAFSGGGAVWLFVNGTNGTFGIASGAGLNWNADPEGYGAFDTGLARSGAGAVKVTNGSSGYGKIDASGYSASGAAGLSVTITTAKLTPATGTNGSMTFTNGILTAQTPAT